MRMNGVMQFIGHCMYRLDPWNPAWEGTQLYRDNLWGEAGNRTLPVAAAPVRLHRAPSERPATARQLENELARES